jgi:hypothetical protein
MGHVRMPRSTEVESRCFRCDRFGELREDKSPEQIVVRKRLDPQRMIPESTWRARRAGNCTKRKRLATPRHGLNSELLPSRRL